MWTAVVYLQNIWPFSGLMFNDLRESDRIVKKLQIPESTRNFVYAIRVPESQAVVYVLAVQNLSERSALDVDCLIRAIKPEAVVVQVGNLNSLEISGAQEGRAGTSKDDKSCLKSEFVSEDSVPTSVFEVLKNCFVLKINREKYENVAGNLVLKEIFGVSFNEHIFAAKKVSEEIGSSFLVLESPLVNCSSSTSVNDESDIDKEPVGTGLGSVLSLQASNLIPAMRTSDISWYSRAFQVSGCIESQMVKSLSSHLACLNPVPKSANEYVVSKSASENLRPLADYDTPQFAKCVYPLLVDLHDIFSDVPSMRTALACAQKMLYHVNKGEAVESQLLSEVYAFQIAVEGLRIALTNAGRQIRNQDLAHCEFSDLPIEDKSQAILAQAIRSQTKKYKSIVAVVDASGLGGLRKHWKTDLPSEVKDMVDQLAISAGDDGELLTHCNRKRLIADKPVVAVGAGATAIFGVSYLSKFIPASSYINIATFPSSLQLLLTQSQKALIFTFGKVLGPTKVVAPGMTSSLKGSVIKAAASADKIRTVVHSVIASAEKTSLSAMRSAFYEIMRKRRVGQISLLPMATFGLSIATCSGLLVYGDGIECAAESAPAAASIANLGRGIQSLHEASLVVRQAESSRIQQSIESLLYKFKNSKIQNKNIQ